MQSSTALRANHSLHLSDTELIRARQRARLEHFMTISGYVTLILSLAVSSFSRTSETCNLDNAYPNLVG